MSEFKKVQSKAIADKIEKGGRCNLCSGILALAKTKRRDCYEALIDKEIENQTIKKVLNNWGVITSDTTIGNHRNGAKGYGLHMANLKKAAGYE